MVVNCAGIMPLSTIAGGDLELIDKVIATNLRGTFVVLGQAARHVSSGGRIIAFSSSVIAKAFPNYGPYIASKAGVEGLVRVLANELRGREITVNAVAPGPVATELFFTGKAEAQIEELRKQPPWNASASRRISPMWYPSLQALMAAGSTVRSFALMEVLYNAFQLRWQHSWTRHRQYLSVIEPETTRRDARSCAATIITVASVSCSFFICCCCWRFAICANGDTVFIDQKEGRKALITGDIYNKSNGLWRRISPLEDLQIRAKTSKSGRR